MDVTVRVNNCSAEVSDSLRQMEDLFGAALHREAKSLPEIDGVSALQFNPTATHPIVGRNEKARASLHRPTSTYYVRTPVSYVGWANPDWSSRLDAFADGLLNAVASLPKSRFGPELRDALVAAVEKAKSALFHDPPQRVAPVRSIFLHVDDQGKPTSVAFNSDGPRPAGKAIEITPQEAGSYEGFQLWGTRDEPEMFKLYLRDSEGRLLYHEAWYTNQKVVEHWGVCGDKGQQREHEAPAIADANKVLSGLKKAARAIGYRPIPQGKMKMLIVEYPISGFGSPRDLERRHSLENYFNELVGWLGLGHLDGGSTGSGTMEVALVVVDFEIARTAIQSATKDVDAGRFSRIYEMR